MQDVLATLASLRFGLVTPQQVVDAASHALVSGGSALDMALASLYPDDYESVDSLLVEGLAASGEAHSDDDVWWAFIGEVARRVDRGEMDVECGGRTIRRHTMLTENSEQYVADLIGIESDLDDGDGRNPESLEALGALLRELRERASRHRKRGAVDSDEADDLPEFAAWRSQYVPPLDEVSYLATHLEVTSAALFAKLMMPEFVAVGGCVLVKDRFSPERFEEWMITAHGSTVVVERALNRLHLWDVFQTDSEAEERALVRLAERMAVSWKLHASSQFPDREFEAEVTDDYGPTVVLWSTSERRRTVTDRVGGEVA